MKPYNTILFDLEGTLVDFQWNLEPAAREIKAELTGAGLDPNLYGRDPDYAALFNRTREFTASWPHPEKEKLFEKLDAIYDAYDDDALSRWQPYPDTSETLETLTQSGCRMGVVSNCGRMAVLAVLKKFDLLSLFELVISRNDVRYVKPDPEGLLKAADALKTNMQKILFVGDSANDILPACKIGMPSCFLSCGESIVTGNTQTPATHQVKQLKDILSLSHS